MSCLPGPIWKLFWQLSQTHKAVGWSGAPRALCANALWRFGVAPHRLVDERIFGGIPGRDSLQEQSDLTLLRRHVWIRSYYKTEELDLTLISAGNKVICSETNLAILGIAKTQAQRGQGAPRFMRKYRGSFREASLIEEFGRP